MNSSYDKKLELSYGCFSANMNSEPSDPTISPLLYPSHANLPPAVVQVAGLDFLRDEGILYDKVLQEAGVPTKLFVYVVSFRYQHVIYSDCIATQVSWRLAWLPRRFQAVRSDQEVRG